MNIYPIFLFLKIVLDLFLNKYQKKKFNFGSNQEREVIKPIKKDSKKKTVAKIILNVENNMKRNKKLFPKLSQSKITLRDSISSNDLIKKLFEFNQDSSF